MKKLFRSWQFIAVGFVFSQMAIYSNPSLETWHKYALTGASLIFAGVMKSIAE